MDETVRVRKRGAILAAFWVFLLIASLFSLSSLSHYFSGYSQSHSIMSLSWAGYAVSNGAVDDKLEVVQISATWTVPKINSSASNGHSSAWIGIGGQADKTLIQAGTEHNLVGGQEYYSAWYELLPDYAISIPELAVEPYHTITASIALVDSASEEWLIQISDVTSGQMFSKYVIYDSTRSSGEWIVERPTINGQVSKLADFGTVTFSNCQVTVNDTKGAVGNFTDSHIQMTNQQTLMMASVSPLTLDGSGFTVSYVMSN